MQKRLFSIYNFWSKFTLFFRLLKDGFLNFSFSILILSHSIISLNKSTSNERLFFIISGHNIYFCTHRKHFFSFPFWFHFNQISTHTQMPTLYTYVLYIFLFCLCIDCLHLQLYRDSKDRYKQGQTKASLSLQHFLGVESGFTLDKESNTIAIICQDVIVVLAFDTRERLIQWQVKNFLLFIWYYSSVKIVPYITNMWFNVVYSLGGLL